MWNGSSHESECVFRWWPLRFNRFHYCLNFPLCKLFLAINENIFKDSSKEKSISQESPEVFKHKRTCACARTSIHTHTLSQFPSIRKATRTMSICLMLLKMGRLRMFLFSFFFCLPDHLARCLKDEDMHQHRGAVMAMEWGEAGTTHTWVLLVTEATTSYVYTVPGTFMLTHVIFPTHADLGFPLLGPPTALPTCSSLFCSGNPSPLT